MIDAGSLGSDPRAPLLVGLRGVPPGDLAACTVRNFTLPMSLSMLPMSGGPGVARRVSADCRGLGALGPGVCREGGMGPSVTEGVDVVVLEEPWNTYNRRRDRVNT